jgi:uncharacterized protein YoxC
MDAGAFMDIAIGVFFLLFGIGLAYALFRLAGTFGEITVMIHDTNHEVAPILNRVQTTVDEVNANLSNVDDITANVATMTEAIDDTTSAVHDAVTAPIKKASVMSAGVSQGVSTFLKGWRKEE